MIDFQTWWTVNAPQLSPLLVISGLPQSWSLSCSKDQVLPHIFAIYNLSFDFFCDQDDGLSKLESEYEIQSKITTAAMKLANDPTISKKVRKTRRDSYKKSALRVSRN